MCKPLKKVSRIERCSPKTDIWPINASDLFEFLKSPWGAPTNKDLSSMKHASTVGFFSKFSRLSGPLKCEFSYLKLVSFKCCTLPPPWPFPAIHTCVFSPPPIWRGKKKSRSSLTSWSLSSPSLYCASCFALISRSALSFAAVLFFWLYASRLLYIYVNRSYSNFR